MSAIPSSSVLPRSQQNPSSTIVARASPGTFRRLHPIECSVIPKIPVQITRLPLVVVVLGLQRRQDFRIDFVHIQRLERRKGPLHGEQLDHGLVVHLDDKVAATRFFSVNLNAGLVSDCLGNLVGPSLEGGSLFASFNRHEEFVANRLFGGRCFRGRRLWSHLRWRCFLCHRFLWSSLFRRRLWLRGRLLGLDRRFGLGGSSSRRASRRSNHGRCVYFTS